MLIFSNTKGFGDICCSNVSIWNLPKSSPAPAWHFCLMSNIVPWQIPVRHIWVWLAIHPKHANHCDQNDRNIGRKICKFFPDFLWPTTVLAIEPKIFDMHCMGAKVTHTAYTAHYTCNCLQATVGAKYQHKGITGRQQQYHIIGKKCTADTRRWLEATGNVGKKPTGQTADHCLLGNNCPHRTMTIMMKASPHLRINHGLGQDNGWVFYAHFLLG